MLVPIYLYAGKFVFLCFDQARLADKSMLFSNLFICCERDILKTNKTILIQCGSLNKGIN